MGITAFHAGRTVRNAISVQIFGKTHQQFAPQIGMRDLASAKLHHGFYPISFLKEANCMVLFEIVIVIVGIGTELQFLHLHHMLLFLCLMRFLFHLVLVVTVIDRFRDRRHCGGRDDNEIQP